MSPTSPKKKPMPPTRPDEGKKKPVPPILPGWMEPVPLPKLGVTPNPLAAVSSSPAQNRNSAIPKTGAVLPFPNPNQPQVDLATPKGVQPVVPSVVGGVTAGAISASPQRIDYADLWWQAQARKDITYQQYNDAVYGRNGLSRYELPPVGKLPAEEGSPPVVGGATGGSLPPVVLSGPGGGSTMQLSSPVATEEAAQDPYPGQPNRQAWEDAIRVNPESAALFRRYRTEANAGFPNPYTPGSLTSGGSLPPTVPLAAEGGPAAQPTAPSATETPEEELQRLQREYIALKTAGEDDPNYQMSAGTAVRIRALEDRMTQLFNQQRGGTLPPVLPTEKTGPVDKVVDTVKTGLEKAADWIASLPPWLRKALDVPTGGMASVVGRFGYKYIDELTDAEITEGLAALAGHEDASRVAQRLQELRDEQTKRGQVKTTSERETLVKALGLDAYGVTAAEFARYSPDQILQLYNRGGSKMTDVQLGGLLETWQKQNPGQKIPVPTKNSRAYLFYQTMKTVGKADALFAPEAAGPAEAVTPQQMSTYMGVLNRLGVLPRTADDAYNWLSVPLEPPPGLIDTNLGWVNADGSPPTPEQQRALNAYISRLDTQKDDREAAYKLIAAENGQRAANDARQEAYYRDEEARKAAEQRAEASQIAAEGRAISEGLAAEKRLESRTISAEQRAEATRIAAEGRAATAKIVEEMRYDARVTIAEDRAIKAGIDAERRLESRTISAEQRAEATQIAAEGRAAAARVVDDSRAVSEGLAAEKRLESRTISAEERAEATRIAAEGRAVSEGIAAEKRLESRTISAEERAEATRIAAEGRAISEGKAAELRLESRTISAEERAEATRIAAEGRAISEGKAAELRLESRTISAEERAEATRIAAEGRAISEGKAAELRLESRTISAEERAEATRIAAEGRAISEGKAAEQRTEAIRIAAEQRAAATRTKQRASGGQPVGAEATAGYRASLKGFTAVPTTLEEAKSWLGQTLPAPPGLTYDATTNQWVDESGNLPTGDRAQAVQDYEFQQSQYGKNRERADAIVKSYADLDAVQRGRDAADAALQRALGTKDVMEQVELTYLLDKAELDLKETQRKSQMIQAYVALTNNPSTAARMKSLGLLDQFNRDTGMNVTVPDKVSKNKVFDMIPSLGDWANMSPQQQMDALEMLSARTGWMPEELAALMSEIAGAPGGFRSGGVSSSTVARRR